jgi:hypothetical protein
MPRSEVSDPTVRMLPTFPLLQGEGKPPATDSDSSQLPKGYDRYGKKKVTGKIYKMPPIYPP